MQTGDLVKFKADVPGFVFSGKVLIGHIIGIHSNPFLWKINVPAHGYFVKATYQLTKLSSEEEMLYRLENS